MSEIALEKMEEVLGGDLKEILKRNKQSHEHLISQKFRIKTIQHIPELNELRVLKKLGAGEFGMVFLVGAKD